MMYYFYWHWQNGAREKGSGFNIPRDMVEALLKNWPDFRYAYPDLIKVTIQDEREVEWFSIRYNEDDHSTETHTRIERSA